MYVVFPIREGAIKCNQLALLDSPNCPNSNSKISQFVGTELTVSKIQNQCVAADVHIATVCHKLIDVLETLLYNGCVVISGNIY